MCVQLFPLDSDLVEKYNREIAEAKEYARRQNVATLGEKVEAKESGKEKDEKENSEQQVCSFFIQ